MVENNIVKMNSPFYNKIFIVLILIFISQIVYGQKKLTEDQKYYSLCMVWGFLKYNHPAVMSGRLDWDKELIEYIDKIKSVNNSQELSQLYISWIENLGKIKAQKSYVSDNSIHDFNKNFDTSWMNNPLLYSKNLSNLLHHIYLNRGRGKDYYAEYRFHLYHFNHEKLYKGMVYPSPPYRLLTLFRYWNIINYFYPSKYLIGENWDTVLKEMIPVFLNAKDTLSYQLAILELVTKLNDSHAYFTTPYLFRYFGEKFTPFMVQIINNKAVVTKILNDSLAKIDNIKIGDAILEIDGKSVEQILRENWKYIPASNTVTKLRNAAFLFLQSKSDSSNILFERNGIKQTKVIHRYVHPQFLMRLSALPDYMINSPWKIIDDSILYINVTSIKKQKLKKFLHHLNNYKGIILDMRVYSKEKGVGIISRAIHRNRVTFVKFLVPSKHDPGKFYFFNTPMEKTGHKNKKFFMGKTILLLNETTQSIGELSCMMLQSANNVVSIGSQTAGADGSAEPIILPGGYMTRFSEMGIYYPDGKPTQRVGIRPDIVVYPTIQDIKEKKDALLEKAVSFIEKVKN